MTDDITGVPFSAEFGACQAWSLFDVYDSFSDLCNLDNTDLGYFAALGSPALRKEIAPRTGAAVPELRLFGLDPMPAPGHV